jgi:hypothetical protein
MSTPPEAVAMISSEGSPTDGKPTWLKVLQGIALAPIMLGGFLLLGYLAAEETKSANPQAACLDSRYMFDILWEVKQSLREPDSFDHISSSATGVDENGVQQILIEFRARNGFGGVNIGKAVADVQFQGCKLVSWRLIDGR